jgi:NOL1/NOP2/sun family putative RNA methylase
MTALPQPFVERIRMQLGGESDSFLHSYEQERVYGLRLYRLKLGFLPADDPLKARLKNLFALEPVPWCPDGFYYEEATKPGKHPFHSAGLYYIQEPSAMCSAELLAPEPGDVVLDLAAAPGGKSTQIGGMLQGRGLLVANDIHPARAKSLSENIERTGIANAIVTNASPDALAARFPACFDKIMLDAPCSGEGMFRKDPDAIREWSPEHVRLCAARQLDILDAASVLLKPGGALVYSTCTFNREENEEVLEQFTARHREFRVERIERIWPHLQRGEGHFAALLRKEERSGNPAGVGKPFRGKKTDAHKPNAPGNKSVREAMRLAEAMLKDVMPNWRLPEGEPILFGEQLYWMPAGPDGTFAASSLDGLKVLRPGLHLAHIRKDRAEPAHALAMAALPDSFAGTADFEPEQPELESYLRGEAIPAPPDASGWTAVTVSGYPLGWAKAGGGQLKNHLPKGIRRHG